MHTLFNIYKVFFFCSSTLHVLNMHQNAPSTHRGSERVFSIEPTSSHIENSITIIILHQINWKFITNIWISNPCIVLLCDYRPHTGIWMMMMLLLILIYLPETLPEYQHRSNNNIKNFTELKNKIDGKCSIKFYEQVHYRNT